MAMMVFTVETVGEKVRLKQENGSYTDFTPAGANQIAGELLKAAMQAVGQVPPQAITVYYK